MFDLPNYYPKPQTFDKASSEAVACWRFAMREYDISTFNERLCRGKVTEEDLEQALGMFKKHPQYETGDEPSFVWPLIVTVVLGVGLFVWYLVAMVQTKQWWTMCFIVFYLFVLSWVFALLYYISIYLFHEKLLRREKAFLAVAKEVNSTILADKDMKIKVGYKSVTLIFELGWKIKEKAKNVNPYKSISFK